MKGKSANSSTIDNTILCFIFRLHASETQYRLEVDRLKVDLQCDQVRFQQLERELTDFKLERTNLDDSQSSDVNQRIVFLSKQVFFCIF